MCTVKRKKTIGKHWRTYAAKFNFSSSQTKNDQIRNYNNKIETEKKRRNLQNGLFFSTYSSSVVLINTDNVRFTAIFKISTITSTIRFDFVRYVQHCIIIYVRNFLIVHEKRLIFRKYFKLSSLQYYNTFLSSYYLYNKTINFFFCLFTPTPHTNKYLYTIKVS